MARCVILSFCLVLLPLPAATRSAIRCDRKVMPLKAFYPNTTIKRMDFPVVSACWKNHLRGYIPPSYSIICPSFTSCDSTCAGLKFNQKDGHVQRRSIFGKYEVTESNVPLNPLGRTGLSGRGLLPRYGPNHLVILILKRISICEQYAVTQDGTRYDLEMFPSAFVDDPYNEIVPTELMNAISKSLREFSKKNSDKIIATAIKKRKLLYWGPAVDNRNTDNAWIELIIWKISDRALPLLALMDFSDDEEFKIKWKCMNKVMVTRKIQIARKRSYQTAAKDAYRRWILLKNRVHNKSKRLISNRTVTNALLSYE